MEDDSFCHAHRFRERLRGCGYRMTMAREAILAVLSETDGHLSADEIFLRIRHGVPHIGLATVYRALEVLVRLALVHKRDFGDGRARYELAHPLKGKPHHHHLICIRCSQVLEYTEFMDEEIALLKMTEQVLSQKYGFHITDHLIQFYGICPNCQKKESKGSF